MAAYGGEVCVSVSLYFEVLHVSSSPLLDIGHQFLFRLGRNRTVRLRKHSHEKKCSHEILQDKLCIIEQLKDLKL